MQALERRDPGTGAAAALAIGVHLLLLLVLFFGISWKTRHPEPVMADLWSQLPAVETPRVQPPPAVAPKPEPRAERKPEPKPEPKVEPKPAPKPDIALEQEKKKKEEAAKKQREDELKAKAEAERKEKEAADRRRREEQAAERQRVQQQLARELGAAAPAVGASVAAADPSAVAGWTDQIKGKVKSNIVLPPDLEGNPEAVFDVVLLPTGEVLSVKLVKSSGNRVLDDAWERAILKSSPLPRPARADAFRRDLRLVFRPRD